MRTIALLSSFLVALAGPVAATDPPHGHIEFLWEARDPAAQARPVALGLVLRPERPHQLCWKSSRFPPGRVAVRLLAQRNGHTVTLVEETVAATAPIVRPLPSARIVTPEGSVPARRSAGPRPNL